MKALVLSEYKQLEIVDMARPEPADDELLIRIQACGICGSDVHGYDGSTGRRLPPIVMGHEAAGIVEAIGSKITGFRPGDRATFDSTVFCGRCFFCLRGQVNLCDAREVIGVSTPAFRRMGAFAEYVTVPARIAYHLPDNMPFTHAALIEAVSVAVHAISITPIVLEDTVVVVGAGMIGLLTLQAALRAGAGRVFVLDVDDTRLELARRLGATHTFNSRSSGMISEIVRLTMGRGADVVLECVGTSVTVQLALDAVRKGGTVTLVGNIAPTIELGLQSVVTRQIRLQGSCASSGEYPACISLMSRGAIQVEPLLSAVAPLEDGAEWFRRLYDREPGLLKVVLQP
ncbi:galactitol-1-phosphate 5-dehydrogenase [Granulicella sp. S190]|uniref:galactitol-1-phosphate 5-dehydrogenase n=1 Tax=Granulicella sp. S190 TaxID=1747226 RepID=UPI00131E3964|nr:galactitol-1-phosphate 5-dehydrogenase [Granulicella sp. S190]